MRIKLIAIYAIPYDIEESILLKQTNYLQLSS